MSHTVQMNSAETVWWFFLFPPLLALVIAAGWCASRALVRRVNARFQARIDCALAMPVHFGDAGPHSDPNGCACPDCLALVAYVRVMLGMDDWDEAAQVELADGAA